MATHQDEAEARLCSACVGELFLKADIQSRGLVAECSFCGKQGKTYSIEELADRVEAALEDHYRQTPSEPSDYEYALINDNEEAYDWEREGEPVLNVIESIVDISEEPAREILSVLQEREGYTEGEEGKFEDEAHYADAAASDQEVHSQWRQFEKSIKTEARFFGTATREILGQVFKDVEAEETVDGGPIVIEAGPEKPISSLFRARVFQSDGKLEEALCRPDLKVGSPPPALATAGRMNAHGISVFYGATDPKVAVAEVRPPVGSRVVVGQFLLTKPVRLLDVEGLRSVLVRGSVFDPDFIRQRQRAKFLERVSHRISVPVMPDDEALEYLVTQVIAEYLASMGFDGVVFPSVQVANGKNIVLFHAAARVEELEIPEGAILSARLEEWSDDGPEVDYSVFEKLPAEADSGPAHSVASPQYARDASDPRDVTLRLDTSNLEVRHIRSVSFETESHHVSRHRYRVTDFEL